MKNKNYHALALSYFNFFNNRDILNLEKIISKNISLTDWTGIYKGKEIFLNIYKRIFKKKIQVKVIGSYFSKKQKKKDYDMSICFLLEVKSLSKKIKVIDILFFKNNRIVKILAFK